MHIRFDGYEIGCTHDDDVYITQYETGEMAVDDHDSPRLGRDGVMPGTDYLRGAQWLFELSTHRQDGTSGVLGQFGELERRWKAWANRSNGAAVLEYQSSHDAPWHKIYGRPRQYLPPTVGGLTKQGRGKAQIAFQQLDPLHYSVDEDTTSIGVAPGASGGLVARIRVPIRVARTGGTLDRHAVNNGSADAPVTLRFDGPVRDPEVRLQGDWRFTIRGSLEWDEYLVIDPMNRTATVYSTTSNRTRTAYTMIANGSRFSDLLLPPGQNSLQFTAIDDTYTASVTASWPHTSISMQ